MPILSPLPALETVQNMLPRVERACCAGLTFRIKPGALRVSVTERANLLVYSSKDLAVPMAKASESFQHRPGVPQKEREVFPYLTRRKQFTLIVHSGRAYQISR